MVQQESGRRGSQTWYPSSPVSPQHWYTSCTSSHSPSRTVTFSSCKPGCMFAHKISQINKKISRRILFSPRLRRSPAWMPELELFWWWSSLVWSLSRRAVESAAARERASVSPEPRPWTVRRRGPGLDTRQVPRPTTEQARPARLESSSSSGLSNRCGVRREKR